MNSEADDFFVIKPGLMKWIVEQDSLQYEPDSPMYSKESFEGLHLKSIVLDTLYEKRINRPTKVQGIALPAILADPPRDIIYQSPSGTGKTIALIIAMLSRINESKNCTQILCLAPTLIAAKKLAHNVAGYLSFAKLYAVLTGYDIESDYDIRGKDIVAHVAVGTAESMLDWLKQSSTDLSNITVLMIDEVDFLMKSRECWNDCEKLVKLLPSTCQMVFCSTTIDESSIKTASAIMKTPDITILSPISECLKTVTQYYIQSTSRDDKYHVICELYDCLIRKRNKGNRSLNKIMVFCNEPETAMWLYKRMEADERYFETSHNMKYFKVSLVKEDLKFETDYSLMAMPDSRFKFTDLVGPYSELVAFTCFDTKVLITTDVLSRAIVYSVNRICVIVNFELPVNQFGEVDFETYVHRISRSGRYDKEATAINLSDKRDCMAIEEYFGKEVQPLDVNDPNELDLKLWP